MTRQQGRAYRDPLEEIWLRTAERLGWRVVRSASVYASWDGAGTLTVSTPEGFDPDDCLAQMILHEICHALIEAPRAGLLRPDWGLENVDERDLSREYACHRLQAALTGPWGLREVLAPTTEHRPYYEALPPDPLEPSSTIPEEVGIIEAARAGWRQASQGPWAEILADALRATAEVAAMVRAFGGEGLLSQARPVHPTRLPPGADPERRCGGCAWFRREEEAGWCMQAEAATTAEEVGCRRWERPLGAEDCAGCGACCRHGFDVVDVEEGSPLFQTRTEWIVDHGFGPQIPRPEGFCPALTRRVPYRCAVYAERPRGCRELEIGGEACLVARRRAGVVTGK